MQFVRLLKWLLIFLILSVFVMLLVLTTVSFSFVEITKPQNSKTILFSMLSMAMPKDVNSDAMRNQILHDCENKEELQLPLDEGNDSITINCNDVRNNKPLDETMLDSLFDKIYYKDYGCSFLQCFEKTDKKEPPLFIFAKVANDFFKNLSTKVIVAVIIAGIIILLLGGIRILAKNLITAGLPFLIILLTRNSITQQISSSQNLQPLTPLITSLDAAMTRIFAAFLITGIILYTISFLLRKKKEKKKEIKPAKPKAKPKPAKQKARKKKR